MSEPELTETLIVSRHYTPAEILQAARLMGWDEPEWPGPDSDQLARELTESVWRPRDVRDADVHPESLRGQALALMDRMDATERQIKSTRRGRLVWRVAQLWAKLRERAG